VGTARTRGQRLVRRAARRVDGGETGRSSLRRRECGVAQENALGRGGANAALRAGGPRTALPQERRLQRHARLVVRMGGCTIGVDRRSGLLATPRSAAAVHASFVVSTFTSARNGNAETRVALAHGVSLAAAPTVTGDGAVHTRRGDARSRHDRRGGVRGNADEHAGRHRQGDTSDSDC
jgi:hypothetical protein